ncbi:hypothetical protein JTE90_012537 [Oedothorax gibbosus]|uniref:C2H2-type domain-containing protein n=1 Tax=Oedothorax gibbosus TaxID=931172 RepID=A0AAV6U5P5_9ARAC|nr:hypothetical protein JTE90_012537 [Oedothorax gibbosus]
MEFMHKSPIAAKDHECLYCSQKYPSERDLSIHEYIHRSYMREAIFNLTSQPRNSYLIYEDFYFVCGRMKSGLMSKELGSAETPEQELIESPNKKEFDKMVSNNLPCHQLTPPEYNKKLLDKYSSNNLSFHQLTPPQSDEKLPNKKQFFESSSNLQNSQHLIPPQFCKKPPAKKESDSTSSDMFCHNLSPMPHSQEQASHAPESRTDLFAYKTFEGAYSTGSVEEVEFLKALTEDLLVKYGTFPTRNNEKARENWADRYKTSLVSEAVGRGEPPLAFSPGIRF